MRNWNTGTTRGYAEKIIVKAGVEAFFADNFLLKNGPVMNAFVCWKVAADQGEQDQND